MSGEVQRYYRGALGRRGCGAGGLKGGSRSDVPHARFFKEKKFTDPS